MTEKQMCDKLFEMRKMCIELESAAYNSNSHITFDRLNDLETEIISVFNFIKSIEACRESGISEDQIYK